MTLAVQALLKLTRFLHQVARGERGRDLEATVGFGVLSGVSDMARF